MSTTKPIKDRQALESLKNYYLKREQYRNHALIIIGLNTALRISDILSLQWKHVYSFNKNCFRKHIYIVERKTHKESIIALNASVISALSLLLDKAAQQGKALKPDDYLFEGRNHTNMPISRSQAYRIIKEAAAACGMDEHVSCHSLRKTFGYFAWKQGVPPVMLMNIYNHSTFQITKRYLCIEQDERDEIFLTIKI